MSKKIKDTTGHFAAENYKIWKLTPKDCELRLTTETNKKETAP